ncbi:protein HEXIM1 [Leptidea sinapis]|uniref:protein HEXIM1 n=1 Tax=Leptidea sinapis TaxID=189913 RepID=UPI00213BD490|nr:protein HEXIM1 [Leptidea sinapis]
MDVNKIPAKDGDTTSLVLLEPPSILTLAKPKFENIKKKRRRGKTKCKLSKPYLKSSWQERRKNEVRNNNPNRNNRFRKVVMAKTQAPFNNNQFLMEIHKPEPENDMNIFRTPSARTRDSSFSIDSEENYFYSLPEDEEEYLTKEFSSVYEDAQTERLTNMSKNELIQEYLLLEAKYETLIKRSDRLKGKENEEKIVDVIDKDAIIDRNSMITDKDISDTILSGTTEEKSVLEILQRLKEQEEKIKDLEVINEKLKHENEILKKNASSSSEDSESDSSSSSDSCSSSSCNSSPKPDENMSEPTCPMNGDHSSMDGGQSETLVNGFHNLSE